MTDENDYSGDRVVAWRDGGPVTKAQHDEERKRSGASRVATAGPELLGDPSAPAGQSDAGDGQVDPAAEVPSNAADVVAWITEGGELSEEEGARRAGAAWTVEAARSQGVRATVEAAVDAYLVNDGDGAGEDDAD